MYFVAFALLSAMATARRSLDGSSRQLLDHVAPYSPSPSPAMYGGYYGEEAPLGPVTDDMTLPFEPTPTMAPSPTPTTPTEMTDNFIIEETDIELLPPEVEALGPCYMAHMKDTVEG